MKFKFPLLKLLVYLLVGFLIGYSTNIDTTVLIVLSLFSILISFFSSIPNNIKYSIISILIGIVLYNNVNLYQLSGLEKQIPATFEGVFIGQITEVKSKNINNKRFVAKGTIKSKALSSSYNLNVIYTLFDKNNSLELRPGYNFISKTRFRIGQPKVLDEDFNEKSYLLSNKAIFYANSSVKDFSITKKDYLFKTFLYELKEIIKSIITSVISDQKVSGIMIALTTGDKSGIDKETKSDFSQTGTAHVLAISGLHVGIFSLFIYTLIGFLRNRLIKMLIFIVLLWLFVIFTGGQPSAVRAAIMASLFIYLIYYGKVPKPLNVLLFTILLYLIIEPTIAYSISFQLSVFAILGIFLLHKTIYTLILKLLIKENFVTRFISSSFAISFAATIPTSFLTAYYFNTFSVIYPIANLIVLPIMTYAAFQSMFYVFFSAISLPFADLFANSSYYAIKLALIINNYFAGIGDSHFLNNSNLLYHSIVVSIFLLYILTSRNIQKLIFRFVVATCTIVLIYNIYLHDDNNLIVLPREQYTGLIVNDDKNKYIILSDRKYYYYLNKDLALTNNIANSKKNIIIFKTGNVSINLNDQVKHLPNVDSRFISLSKVDSIANQLNLNPLYRIVNTND